MRAIVIPVAGEIRWEEVGEDADSTMLDSLQGLVGGYIQGVGLSLDNAMGEYEAAILYCNEEGKLKHLTPNPRATMLCRGAGLMRGDFIAGDAVVMGGPDDEGNETECSQQLFEVASGRWD